MPLEFRKKELDNICYIFVVMNVGVRFSELNSYYIIYIYNICMIILTFRGYIL